MLVTKVELTNIKSYGDSGVIEFAPGVNAISGPTGAGKSTILEAIGFALFDAAPFRSQRQFISEGAKRGEVAVSFIDALDEREYQVVRPLGAGTPYVHDPEIHQRIVTGKSDVFDWLKEHLRVEPTADLSALFTDAIGVPQGLLTAPFLETPRERKRKFDPLLQVDDYESVWQKLRDTSSYIDTQSAAQKQQAAALAAELKRLPQLASEAAALQEDMASTQARQTDIDARLAVVATEKDALDAALVRVDELTHQAQAIDQQMEALAQQVSVARAEHQRAQQAQRVIGETEAPYRHYEAAQVQLNSLLQQQRERDTLTTQLAHTDRALALAGQKVTMLQQALQEATQAQASMAALQPLLAQQTSLEEEVGVAERDAQLFQQAEARLEEESARLERLEANQQRVQQQLKTLAALETKQATLATQRQELERRVAAMQAQQGHASTQRQELEQRLAMLTGEEAADCPVCQRPLEAHQADELRAHFRDELDALATTARAADLELAQVRHAMQGADKEATALANEARSLPHRGREAELVRELDALRTLVAEWQERHAILSAAPDLAADLHQRLQTLGDPRVEYERLKVQADQAAQNEADLATARREQARDDETRQSLLEALKAFAGLDEQIHAARDAMATSEADHARYLEHRKLAQTLPERAAALEQLGASRAEVDAAREEAAKRLAAARIAYDQARHLQLTAEFQALTTERAKLEERLRLGQNRLTALRQEIDSLEQRQAELDQAQQEIELLGHLADVLAFIRKTIRQAGPYVTRALVSIISGEADRIFSDILDDHIMRLAWEQDYGITIEQLGNKRDFGQLSGGEKTAAALAVRLALLREMSDIRIAFFDEPTAHLDDERRDNLAAQIAQIKGFHQLFVISHDDTFERETHHILRVSKQNAVSQVEVG